MQGCGGTGGVGVLNEVVRGGDILKGCHTGEGWGGRGLLGGVRDLVEPALPCGRS